MFAYQSLTDDELAARAVDLERERTGIDAEQATVLAELEARGVCDRDFGLTTPRWLAREAGLPAVVAKARVRVAWKLRRWFPHVADALGAGTISWEHAKVIVDVANHRILHVVADNQVLLLALAERCRFEPWKAEVQGLARLWDQDGGYDPDDDPASNRLSYGTTIDGLTALAARWTGDHGLVITQAIEAKTDELYRRAVRDHQQCPELPVPSRATLRALALAELIRHSLGVDLDSTRPPEVEGTFVIPADDPTDTTDPDGVPLADGTTRVLGCDAVFVPLIVDRLGVPLDLARRVRLATPAQRRAVRRRDGACTFPGCDARVAWCDVHHCIHYDDDGPTDLCNLVCLCRHHHTVTHRNGWSVRVHTDGWTIFTSPTGHTFWGQRHGRRRDGPVPAPPSSTSRPPREPVLPARYETAYCRQRIHQRLDELRRPRADVLASGP